MKKKKSITGKTQFKKQELKKDPNLGKNFQLLNRNVIQ